jgi:hypothetical protein
MMGSRANQQDLFARISSCGYTSQTEAVHGDVVQNYTQIDYMIKWWLTPSIRSNPIQTYWRIRNPLSHYEQLTFLYLARKICRPEDITAAAAIGGDIGVAVSCQMNNRTTC